MLSGRVLFIIMPNFIMLSRAMLSVLNAECRYAECGYAECHYDESCYAEFRSANKTSVLDTQSCSLKLIFYRQG
jgi:hypothetical protein